MAARRQLASLRAKVVPVGRETAVLPSVKMTKSNPAVMKLGTSHTYQRIVDNRKNFSVTSRKYMPVRMVRTSRLACNMGMDIGIWIGEDKIPEATPHISRKRLYKPMASDRPFWRLYSRSAKMKLKMVRGLN